MKPEKEDSHMTLFRRFLVAAFIFLFVLPVIAAAQKDESQKSSSKDLELKACGPKEKEVKYSADTDKSQHPTGTPTADAALIYVVRTTRFGGKIQTKLAVDGEWKGVNRGNNYFFFTLTPGEHYFCSKAENSSVLVLTVEAGKTYYLAQTIHTGMWKARNDLVVIDDEEGKKELEKAHPSTWKIK
jgi:hypothetical protein